MMGRVGARSDARFAVLGTDGKETSAKDEISATYNPDLARLREPDAS